MTAVVLAASWDNWLGLGLAVALLGFLVLALLYPERF
jgi:K+-transporting ATPase KdpF subunit